MKRDDVLTLTTVRSHHQYNTTIYGLNDRYRGITGRRDVVFVNQKDLADRGLRHGDPIELEAVFDDGRPEPRRVYGGLTAVAHDIAAGSIAAYYPEANVLASLADFDPRSGTPSYKSIPVLLRAAVRPADQLRPPHGPSKPDKEQRPVAHPSEVGTASSDEFLDVGRDQRR